MANENGLLLYMVADLMRDAAKQGAFVENPDSVMNSYGLSDHQRSIFYSMSAPRIGEFIREEFTANAPLQGGAPVLPDWPVPDPQVRSFEPRAAAPGVLVALTIRGEGLLPTAAVRLIPRSADGGPTVAGTVDGVSGTFREAQMQATFDLSDATAGEYRIEVSNGSDVPPLRSWKNGPFFKVQ
jgi:hypothetical protein